MKVFFIVVFVILSVVAPIAVVVIAYQNWASVDQGVYRAQVSGDISVMTTRIDEVTATMEARGMTHGYSALIFKSPSTDVSLDYDALKQLSERGHLMSTKDKTSVEYQTALSDMRGTLRELGINAFWWTVWNTWLTWGCIGSWIGLWVSTSVKAQRSPYSEPQKAETA